MKILPPTLRDFHRYMAFSMEAEDEVSRRDLINEVLFSAATLVGDVGSSELGLRLMAFEDHKGIIQCSANRVWESRAVLAAVSSVKGVRLRIKVLGVSGTVRAATEKYLLTRNINQVEPEKKKKKEPEHCEIRIDNKTISGTIIYRVNNEIDIIPEDPLYKKILEYSDTRYMGITVFDIMNKEID